LAGAEGNAKKYSCDTCGTISGEKKTRGKVHAIGQDARLSICISSSTLHNFWLDSSYEGHDVHIDWVTCPGAKIQDLAEIWKVEYGKEERPMDILVVGGLNNCKLEDKETIMGHIHKFYEVVITQTEEFHPKKHSTFQVSTLFYPPQFCSFKKKMPHVSFVNRLEMMKSLNTSIMTFNQKVFELQEEVYAAQWDGMAGTKTRVPRFHTYGLRKKRVLRGKKIVEIVEHRLNWYREKQVVKMLHLSDKHRCTMGTAINRYFKHIFEPLF